MMEAVIIGLTIQKITIDKSTEACALLIKELDRRFDQTNLLPPILCIETILLKASNLETYSEELESFKLSMYKDDVEIDQLSRQLPLLGDVIKQALPSVKQVTTIQTICDAMNTESVYKSMLSEIHKLLRLYLTIPISSSTSERSFSALK